MPSAPSFAGGQNDPGAAALVVLFLGRRVCHRHPAMGSKMTETFIPRASTNIAKVDYDSDSQSMTITFKTGDAWEYSGVPRNLFLGIQNAASAGGYFYRQIRGSFNEQKV